MPKCRLADATYGWPVWFSSCVEGEELPEQNPESVHLTGLGQMAECCSIPSMAQQGPAENLGTGSGRQCLPDAKVSEEVKRGLQKIPYWLCCSSHSPFLQSTDGKECSCSRASYQEFFPSNFSNRQSAFMVIPGRNFPVTTNMMRLVKTDKFWSPTLDQQSQDSHAVR